MGTERLSNCMYGGSFNQSGSLGANISESTSEGANDRPRGGVREGPSLNLESVYIRQAKESDAREDLALSSIGAHA